MMDCHLPKNGFAKIKIEFDSYRQAYSYYLVNLELMATQVNLATIYYLATQILTIDSLFHKACNNK